MKITNSTNLPPTLAAALSWDDYSKSKSDISITELLKSPRQRALQKRHDAEIVVDCSENLWVLMGRAVHKVLENSVNYVKGGLNGMVEERLFTKVKGPLSEWTVSGQFDMLEDRNGLLVLSDYKVMSVWGYIMEKDRGGVKEDHEAQLNILRWLLHRHSFNVGALEVNMIFRDWKKSDLEKSISAGKSDYPQAPVISVPVALWPMSDIEAFVSNRVAMHQQAEKMADDDLPQCTPSERWQRGDSWAVLKKKDSARAFKVCDSEIEAECVAEDIKGVVQFRPGKSVKCRDYCFASKMCNQFKKELEAENARNAVTA